MIFLDITSRLSTYSNLYSRYIKLKSKTKAKLDKELFTRLRKFWLDFEIVPQKISLRAVYYITYDITTNIDNLQALTNSSEYAHVNNILPEDKEKGSYFKLSHFIIFIYRLSIASFYYNRSHEFSKEYKFDNSNDQYGKLKQNVVKFLFFWRSIEVCDAMKRYDLWNFKLIPPNDKLLKYLDDEDRVLLRIDQKSRSQVRDESTYGKNTSLWDTNLNLANMILLTKNQKQSRNYIRWKSSMSTSSNKLDQNSYYWSSTSALSPYQRK